MTKNNKISQPTKDPIYARGGLRSRRRTKQAIRTICLAESIRSVQDKVFIVAQCSELFLDDADQVGRLHQDGHFLADGLQTVIHLHTKEETIINN